MKPEAGPTTAAAGPPAAAAWTVLCPGCGYDLRGTAADRCSECGLVIDRAALADSGFPWARRRHIGRLRAFWRTVWAVATDSSALRDEPAKPQTPRDAAAFRRVLGGVLAVCSGVAVVLLVESGAVAGVAVYPGSPVLARIPPGNLLQDLLVPWSAGVTLRPALFAYAAAFAFYLPGAARAVFRTRGLPPDRAAPVETIGGYVAGPLAFLLPAAAACAAAYRLDLLDRFSPARAAPVALVLGAASVLLSLAAIGLTVYRTGQWRARTAHPGRSTDVRAMAELLLRWAVGAAAFLFVVPWCVGLTWIAFDSFRD